MIIVIQHIQHNYFYYYDNHRCCYQDIRMFVSKLGGHFVFGSKARDLCLPHPYLVVSHDRTFELETWKLWNYVMWHWTIKHGSGGDEIFVELVNPNVWFVLTSSTNQPPPTSRSVRTWSNKVQACQNTDEILIFSTIDYQMWNRFTQLRWDFIITWVTYLLSNGNGWLTQIKMKATKLWLLYKLPKSD